MAAVIRRSLLLLLLWVMLMTMTMVMMVTAFRDNNCIIRGSSTVALTFVQSRTTRQKLTTTTTTTVALNRSIRQEHPEPCSRQQQVLLPEENPHANPNAVSAADRRYGEVFKGIHTTLFPPQLLEQRNAISRTDGYWPYIQAGQPPPPQFTYGEFDFYFLAQLLDTVLQYYYNDETNDDDDNFNNNKKKDWNDKVFVDIGSGVGRLVLAAAALHPNWKLCRGIEVLPALHEQAQEKLLACRQQPIMKSQQLESEEEKTTFDDKVVSNEATCSTSSYSGDGSVGEEHSAWQMALAKLIESSAQEDDDDEEGRKEVQVENSNSNKKESCENNEHGDEGAQYEYELPLLLSSGQNDATESASSSQSQSLTLAPVEFVCGSLDDPYIYFGDADCIFCFSSCMPPEVIDRLAQAVGRQCRPGTIVITTDRMLPLKGYCDPDDMDDRIPAGSFEFELVDKIDGYGWITGGTTTAYIHKVKQSLWVAGWGPLQPKELTLEDKAFKVYKAMEKGELSDPKAFVRAVYNDMVFAGLPERFLPKLDDNNESEPGA